MGGLAFDTETKGLDWFDKDQQAFMVSWADESGAYAADLTDEDGVSRFREAVDRADYLVAHNLSFDVHQVRESIGLDLLELGKPLHDTDLMSRVMYPEGQRKGERGGHGLKNLAKIWISPDAADAEAHMFALADSSGIKMRQQGGYYDMYRAYPEVMSYYAEQDARITLDLYKLFASQISGRTADLYELERAVAPVLIRAEQRGVALDQEPVRKLRREWKAIQAEKFEYLSAELGEEALGGPGSEAALIEALQKIGIPLYRKSNNGKLETNRFALQEFEADFPQIQALFDYRRANKFLTTYIEPMVGRDVVHTSFRQIEAWTGRMSSVRPNMQNVPKAAGKEMRSMFVPREDHVFIVCDYEQVELRLLAYYLAGKSLIELIESGHDAFAWLAAEVKGGDYEFYLKGNEGEPVRKDYKNVTYAICYGAGGPRVTDMLGLDPGPYWDDNHPAIVEARKKDRDWPKPGFQHHEARAVIAKVKAALPNYHKLNKRVRDKIKDVGHVNTLFGRKQIVAKDKSYVGLDALIQGSAADIMKQGLVLVDEAVRPLGGIPLLVVHDEALVEVPKEYAEEAFQLTQQAMCNAHPLRPALTVEGSIVTTNYADA